MSRVVVERAGLLGSAHRVHVAVVDSRGRLTASVEDAERIVFIDRPTNRSRPSPSWTIGWPTGWVLLRRSWRCVAPPTTVNRSTSPWPSPSCRRWASKTVTWNAVPIFPLTMRRPRHCFRWVGLRARSTTTALENMPGCWRWRLLMAGRRVGIFVETTPFRCG